MLELYSNRTHFYQWDLNQKVKVEDNTIKEIHFDNGTENALVCAVYEYEGQRVADVPNILLQKYMPIKVYAFCGECVRYETIYDVEKRRKPADYVYTETEVKRYEDLESRIKNLEQGGGADVDLTKYYTKEETDSLLDSVEVDLSGYYTKEETNNTIETALDTVRGGEYELIEAFTIEEKYTSAIIRSEEPDGKPYKFQKLYVVSTSPKGEGNHDKWPQINTEKGTIIQTSWAAYQTTNQEILAYFVCEVDSGGILSIESNKSALSPSGNYTAINAHKFTVKTPPNDAINYFQVWGSAASPFYAGTTFEIWGVRADA